MAQTSMFHGDLVSSSRILYTPSAFARTSLIHLQEIGRLEAKQPHTSKRDHLMSFLFFIVLTGSGTLKYHETIHRLQAGDCVFLDCRSPYSHQTSENLWQLKWIHFYGPNMADIYDKYTERGGRTAFHPVLLHPYEQLLDDLYRDAAFEAAADAKVLKTVLAQDGLAQDSPFPSPSGEETPGQ